jgi:hypothetical protein
MPKEWTGGTELSSRAYRGGQRSGDEVRPCRFTNEGSMTASCSAASRRRPVDEAPMTLLRLRQPLMRNLQRLNRNIVRRRVKAWSDPLCRPAFHETPAAFLLAAFIRQDYGAVLALSLGRSCPVMPNPQVEITRSAPPIDSGEETEDVLHFEQFAEKSPPKRAL